MRFRATSCLLILVATLAATMAPASVAAFSFQSSTVTMPAGPWDVALEDVSGDGIVDLVVTNYVANSMSVSLGNGAGGFGPRTDYATGTNPTSIAIGDVNEDATKDIVIANWDSGSISVLLGTGGGSFGARTDYNAGSRPISARLARMDADAHLDVVVANRNASTVRVMPGNGAGAFALGTTYATGVFAYDVALAHLNGDTSLDMVVGHNVVGSNVALMLGNGVGGFGAASAVAMGSTPIGVALGDLDANGKADLVSGNNAGSTISIRLGDGLGGFGAKLDLATLPGPFGVAIGDLDHDGKADVAVANAGAASVSLFPGDGLGGFGARQDYGAGTTPTRVAIADLNGDTWLDFAVTNQGSASVTVFLNTGNPIGVPSAATSTCPASASVGPSGTCCFDVIVRDFASNPLAGVTTAIDFDGCPPILCPTQPPGMQLVGNSVRAVTNALGVAHFCICVQPPVPTCNVTVSAEGISLCSIALSSCEGLPSDSCAAPGWRALTVSGPSPRFGSAMVRHEPRGSLFLYGGFDNVSDKGDTWEWDGEAWNPQAGPGPLARHDHAMAYDRARDRMVLFGGLVSGALDGATWEWSAVSGWIQVNNSGPSARSGHAMSYDENLEQVILFGGHDGTSTLGDTWTWNGSSWTLLTSTGPPPRMHMAMATDPEHKRIVLFGGAGTTSPASALGDTWEWDGSAWTSFVAPGPAPRWRHAIAFGAPSSRLFMTGGESAAGAPEPTTWSWNGVSWRAEIGGLSAESHVMAYDFTRGVITSFGGTQAGTPSGLTSQLCCMCDDEAIATDTAGEPIMPPGWDPLEPVTDEIVDVELGDVRVLYPLEHTSADSWLKSYPCPPSVGGTIPPEAFNLGVDDSLQALGIDATAQEIGDSLAAWESEIVSLFGSEPDSMAFLPPIEDYLPPPVPWCPPARDSLNYVFGGRDIVFIHGLMLKHIFNRIDGISGALEDWKFPTATETAEELNPAFYDQGGYYREIAEQNWGEHIESFLEENEIKNRYVIVPYPSSARLRIGIHAVLTQIRDAMQNETNVVDPTNTTKAGFGTPSFVIVSHSTGGLMGAVAMHAARTRSNLNAGFIADHCKGHMALASAFSGSGLATAALVVTGALGRAEPPFLCDLVKYIRKEDGDLTTPPCPWVIGNFFRSVLIDLVPGIAQDLWEPAVSDAGIKTVTLNGGHPTHLWPLKNILHPGFDDGVVNINSACSNPNPFHLWPSGFIAEAGVLTKARTYDMGMQYFDASPMRAIRYLQDQFFDANPLSLTNLIPWYVGAGSLPYLSPTGMLQAVGTEFHDATGLNPKRRRPGYYSFMMSAADHPGIRSGKDHPDYKYSFGLPNNEEARAILEEDEPAMQERYIVGHPLDDQPIVKEGCVPDVFERVVGRRLNFKFKVFNGKDYPKSGWIWKRHYFRPWGYGGNHIIDYGYASVLACEPIAPWCDAPVSVDRTDALGARATSQPNPSFGRVSFSFTLPRAEHVVLTVFDAQGRTVRRLLGRELSAGPHQEEWDRLDDRGARVRAGVYFWKLRAGSLETSKRVVLVR